MIRIGPSRYPDPYGSAIIALAPRQSRREGNRMAEEQSTERWECVVCGYIHEGPLPDDFICPICGVGADQFEKLD